MHRASPQGDSQKSEELPSQLPCMQTFAMSCNLPFATCNPECVPFPTDGEGRPAPAVHAKALQLRPKGPSRGA